MIIISHLTDILNLFQQEAHGTQGLRTEQQSQTELLGQVGESPLLIVFLKKISFMLLLMLVHSTKKLQ